MELLTKDQYSKIGHIFSEIPFNTFFAETVVKKEIEGKVYADNPENPQSLYIVHPYGMSLLYGKIDNNLFNGWLVKHALNRDRKREGAEFMQIFPFKWEDELKDLFKDKIFPFDKAVKGCIKKALRINFKFNPLKYISFAEGIKEDGLKVVKTDRKLFEKFKGSVTPERFFDSFEDFEKRGVGFTLMFKEEAVSTAFSSFITDYILELGMETFSGFRGRGYALIICSVLIDYCIQNGYEPLWACMLQNTPSYRLAERLGFEEKLRMPYYILPA